MIALGNRVHIFVRPRFKDRLSSCMKDVLGCDGPISLKAPGLSEPILAWNFPNGGSLSAEFTDDALDEPQARRGCWLEIKAADPAVITKKLREAGLPEVTYLGNDYFVLPGGQVVRVAPA